MTSGLPRFLFCVALLPGLLLGAGCDPVQEWASQNSPDRLVVAPASVEALPIFHRGNCVEFPAGWLHSAVRWGETILAASPSPAAEQGWASTRAAGLPAEIQYLRLLI
jgi:hypothetical protein